VSNSPQSSSPSPATGGHQSRLRRLSKVAFGPDWRLTGMVIGDALARRRGALLAFAQEGEDGIIRRLTEGQAHGFYVDIGAHHPTRFSNTMALYLRGWSGVNVDAMPGSMAPFRKLRPRDVNIECGVSATVGEMIFHVFDDAALNTFDERLVQPWVDKGYHLIRQVSVKTRPLADILDEHHPADRPIDLLSVDVEGLDAEVLASNDWSRHRPRMVCFERFHGGADHPTGDDATSVCRDNGYIEVAATVHSHVFAEPDFVENIDSRRRGD
jgi:FkbM family methyltransferase